MNITDDLQMFCSLSGVGTSTWSFVGVAFDLVGFVFLTMELRRSKAVSRVQRENRDLLAQDLKKMGSKHSEREKNREQEEINLESQRKENNFSENSTEAIIADLYIKQQFLLSTIAMFTEYKHAEADFKIRGSHNDQAERYDSVHLIDWAIGFLVVGFILQLFGTFPWC